MLELHNESGWRGGLYPGWNLEREFQFTVVFKAGFRFDLQGQIFPLKETPPLIEADEHHGKPRQTSLKAVNEIAPFKQGSEVYLFGTAYPSKRGQKISEVGLGIGFADQTGFKKVLRVFGRRQWIRSMLGHIMSEPEPLEPTPLIYENAFGGFHPENPDEAYPLNPVGLGLNGKGWAATNLELPRIEQGPDFISNTSNTPPPAGFAPIPVFWQPRLSEIGELIETPGYHGACPYSRYAESCLHNVAPGDQRFPNPFTGGEIVHLAGLFPELNLKQIVRFSLPGLRPQLFTVIDNSTTMLQAVCDTLVIDTDKREFCLVWRAGIPWQILDARKGWVVLRDLDMRDEESTKSNEHRESPHSSEAARI